MWFHDYVPKIVSNSKEIQNIIPLQYKTPDKKMLEAALDRSEENTKLLGDWITGST